jgi:hypothetical protein
MPFTQHNLLSIQTKTLVETNTATVTDKMTFVHTATQTQFETEKVTVTQLSTVVQPTTYTSIWIKTDVIDNVRFIYE